MVLAHIKTIFCSSLFFAYIYWRSFFVSMYKAASFFNSDIVDLFNQSSVLLVISIFSKVPFWCSPSPVASMSSVVLNSLVSLPSVTVSLFFFVTQLPLPSPSTGYPSRLRGQPPVCSLCLSPVSLSLPLSSVSLKKEH